MLRLLLPQLSEFGITRLSEITGLDRLGIPVFKAVRPNARTREVVIGAAPDRATAQIGALSTAMEDDHAEFSQRTLRLETWSHFQHQATSIDPHLLPTKSQNLYHDRLPILWTEGFDLVSYRPLWVPLEVVHVNPTVPPAPLGGCFRSERAGIASGWMPADAVLRGLYAIIGRHTCATWDSQASLSQWHDALLDVATVDDGPGAVIAAFERAESMVMIWHLANDANLPVFRVLAVQKTPLRVPGLLDLAMGVGCHHERDIALTQALSCAASDRLSQCVAIENDPSAPCAKASCLIRFADDEGTLDFREIRSQDELAVEQRLSSLLTWLKARGDHAIVVDLSRADAPLHVARTITPAIECEIAAALWHGKRDIRS
jgi:ribosomal protein S12 methylthiotransferase accessory factor